MTSRGNSDVLFLLHFRESDIHMPFDVASKENKDIVVVVVVEVVL